MPESTVNTDSDAAATEVAQQTPPTAGDDAKFAAAIGLTPPNDGAGAKWSLRRKAKPDPTGRPLVTAETASSAAAAVSAQTAAPSTPAGGTASIAGATTTVDQPTGPVPTVPAPAARTTEQPKPAVPPSTAPAAPATPQAEAGAQQHPLVGVTAAPTKESTPLAWWRRRRMRVRRVRRTIRHIDPWSVFKVSLILLACMYIASMAAGVLLWNAAVDSGIVDRLESFVEDVGVFETFEVDGETIFRGASIIGVVLVAAGAAMSVVFTILFNLISDLTGGVRVTVLEEDLGRPARR